MLSKSKFIGNFLIKHFKCFNVNIFVQTRTINFSSSFQTQKIHLTFFSASWKRLKWTEFLIHRIKAIFHKKGWLSSNSEETCYQSLVKKLPRTDKNALITELQNIFISLVKKGWMSVWTYAYSFGHRRFILTYYLWKNWMFNYLRGLYSLICQNCFYL